MIPTLPAARLPHTLAASAIATALVLPGLLPQPARAESLPPPEVPATIRVPAGHAPFLLGRATGTQNYTCQRSSAGFAWTFVAPAATLVDGSGKRIMTHYAGPTWEANDGSTVVGARVDGATVAPDAIPWLLLRAKSTAAGPDGGDRLAATTYIQRVNTTGGLPPSSACNAAKLGAAVKVPYTSDYYFYTAA